MILEVHEHQLYRLRCLLLLQTVFIQATLQFYRPFLLFKYKKEKNNRNKGYDRTIKYLLVIWHKINIYFYLSSIIESQMNEIVEEE